MHKTPDDFTIIAHRGVINVDGIGENTLAAFRRGLADGADGVEFDVYAVEDATDTTRVVVIHDDDVDRTTNGHGNVMDILNSYANWMLARVKRFRLSKKRWRR